MAILLGIAVAAALVWVLLTTLWLWKYQERVVFQPPPLWAVGRRGACVGA